MLGLGSSLSSSSGALDPTIPVPPVNTTTNTKSMHFDGNGDYLSLADHSDFSFNGGVPWSVAAWVKRDSNTGDGFFHKGPQVNQGVGNEYRVFWHQGEIYIDFSDGDGYSQSANYRRIKYSDSSTAWHHIVITVGSWTGGGLSGGVVDFYINGVSQSATGTGYGDNDGFSNENSPFEIGRTNETSKQLGGNICQFIMWRNKKLTQNDVNYLYASGAAHRDPTAQADNYTGSDSVLLWLPLESNANDSSGNSHNMTAGGDAAVESVAPF